MIGVREGSIDCKIGDERRIHRPPRTCYVRLFYLVNSFTSACSCGIYNSSKLGRARVTAKRGRSWREKEESTSALLAAGQPEPLSLPSSCSQPHLLFLA
ncbi:hypothetical protein Y032_0415g1060 [Ancylostoma ceylanicum]|uniref:Uncharacterized protein n=1 Tax=Ancylostoma ceylanicum TaxID=53326 RepID=A0A016X1U5_9BILA|nr:hypothetical protein Y032_0415g1060 [Ancylostoma ceylanicum]